MSGQPLSFDGAEMRRRRQSLGISPAQIAVAIDRCTEAVDCYELGLRMPPLKVLCSICNMLDCTPNDLMPQFAPAMA